MRLPWGERTETLAAAGTVWHRIALASAIYVALCFASMVYIFLFDWWSIEALPRRHLGFALAALGYGAVFWALWAGFAFYFVRLGSIGRRVFLGSAAALIVLLACLWPGFYTSDSYSAIAAGKHFPIDAWLGPFTAIITVAIMAHVPSLGAVASFQVLFFALALASAVDEYARRAAWRMSAFILLAWVATSTPILYLTLRVTRDCWFGIVSIFIVIECIRLFDDPEWRNGRVAARLLSLCCVAMLLRSDGAIYLLFAFAVLSVRWFRSNSPPFGPGMFAFARPALIPAVAILVCSKLILVICLPSYIDKATYGVSLWVNPVAYVVNRSESDIAPADLAIVDRVIPLDLMRSADVDAGIDAFWEAFGSGRIHAPTTSAEHAEVRGAVWRILSQHPKLVLENRMRVFQETNYPHKPLDPKRAMMEYPDAQLYAQSRPRDFNGPLPAVRDELTKLVAASAASPVFRHQWAIWPNLMLLLLILLSFRKLAPGLTFGAGMLLVRFPLLWILSPEALWKYYASFEMATPVLAAAALPVFWTWLGRQRARIADDSAEQETLSSSLFALFQKTIARFGAISLLGWCGDFVLFILLTAAGVLPLVANVFSAGAAITFVYFASIRRVFCYEGHFVYAKFSAYAAYQVLAVAIASFAIAALTRLGVPPLLAKILVTPLTFLANYAFMRWLTAPGRVRLA